MGSKSGAGWFSFRANVARNVRTANRYMLTWHADVFGHPVADKLQNHRAAMLAVEAELERSMTDILVDWAVFLDQSKSRQR
jgi:hypothetical protein